MVEERSALVKRLTRQAALLRLSIVEMLGVGKVGHIGGSFSLAEIVAVLYFHRMRLDPKNPQMPDRDWFLLSKGHGALIQYAALAELGFYDKAAVYPTLKTLGSPLQGHPDMRKVPGIEASTGSLGQGLSIACGMAAGVRLSGYPSKVYCVTGDGELNEGQIWEAYMAARVHRLSNLRVFIDRNGFQAMGRIADRFDIGDINAKLAAFGAAVYEADGHDVAALLDALDLADREAQDGPAVIIAHTVKGKGLPFTENNPAFHNGQFTRAQYDEAVALLKREGGIA